MSSRERDSDRIEDPDIEIGAAVKADRLRFKSKPKTKVEFHGELNEREHRAELETSSGSERENLPDEVEPGVTYRDVRVQWHAAARLPDREDDEEGSR